MNASFRWKLNWEETRSFCSIRDIRVSFTFQLLSCLLWAKHGHEIRIQDRVEVAINQLPCITFCLLILFPSLKFTRRLEFDLRFSSFQSPTHISEKFLHFASFDLINSLSMWKVGGRNKNKNIFTSLIGEFSKKKILLLAEANEYQSRRDSISDGIVCETRTFLSKWRNVIISHFFSFNSSFFILGIFLVNLWTVIRWNSKNFLLS